MISTELLLFTSDGVQTGAAGHSAGGGAANRRHQHVASQQRLNPHVQTGEAVGASCTGVKGSVALCTCTDRREHNGIRYRQAMVQSEASYIDG
jgi:hypothetical protein